MTRPPNGKKRPPGYSPEPDARPEKRARREEVASDDDIMPGPGAKSPQKRKRTLNQHARSSSGAGAGAPSGSAPRRRNKPAVGVPGIPVGRPPGFNNGEIVDLTALLSDSDDEPPAPATQSARPAASAAHSARPAAQATQSARTATQAASNARPAAQAAQSARPAAQATQPASSPTRPTGLPARPPDLPKKPAALHWTPGAVIRPLGSGTQPARNANARPAAAQAPAATQPAPRTTGVMKETWVTPAPKKKKGKEPEVPRPAQAQPQPAATQPQPAAATTQAQPAPKPPQPAPKPRFSATQPTFSAPRPKAVPKAPQPAPKPPQPAPLASGSERPRSPSRSFSPPETISQPLPLPPVTQKSPQKSSQRPAPAPQKPPRPAQKQAQPAPRSSQSAPKPTEPVQKPPQVVQKPAQPAQKQTQPAPRPSQPAQKQRQSAATQPQSAQRQPPVASGSGRARSLSGSFSPPATISQPLPPAPQRQPPASQKPPPASQKPPPASQKQTPAASQKQPPSQRTAPSPNKRVATPQSQRAVPPQIQSAAQPPQRRPSAPSGNNASEAIVIDSSDEDEPPATQLPKRNAPARAPVPSSDSEIEVLDGPRAPLTRRVPNPDSDIEVTEGAFTSAAGSQPASVSAPARPARRTRSPSSDFHMGDSPPRVPSPPPLPEQRQEDPLRPRQSSLTPFDDGENVDTPVRPSVNSSNGQSPAVNARLRPASWSSSPSSTQPSPSKPRAAEQSSPAKAGPSPSAPLLRPVVQPARASSHDSMDDMYATPPPRGQPAQQRLRTPTPSAEAEDASTSTGGQPVAAAADLAAAKPTSAASDVQGVSVLTPASASEETDSTLQSTPKQPTKFRPASKAIPATQPLPKSPFTFSSTTPTQPAAASASTPAASAFTFKSMYTPVTRLDLHDFNPEQDDSLPPPPPPPPPSTLGAPASSQASASAPARPRTPVQQSPIQPLVLPTSFYGDLTPPSTPNRLPSPAKLSTPKQSTASSTAVPSSAPSLQRSQSLAPWATLQTADSQEQGDDVTMGKAATDEDEEDDYEEDKDELKHSSPEPYVPLLPMKKPKKKAAAAGKKADAGAAKQTSARKPLGARKVVPEPPPAPLAGPSTANSAGATPAPAVPSSAPVLKLSATLDRLAIVPDPPAGRATLQQSSAAESSEGAPAAVAPPEVAPATEPVLGEDVEMVEVEELATPRPVPAVSAMPPSGSLVPATPPQNAPTHVKVRDQQGNTATLPLGQELGAGNDKAPPLVLKMPPHVHDAQAGQHASPAIEQAPQRQAEQTAATARDALGSGAVAAEAGEEPRAPASSPLVPFTSTPRTKLSMPKPIRGRTSRDRLRLSQRGLGSPTLGRTSTSQSPTKSRDASALMPPPPIAGVDESAAARAAPSPRGLLPAATLGDVRAQSVHEETVVTPRQMPPSLRVSTSSARSRSRSRSQTPQTPLSAAPTLRDPTPPSPTPTPAASFANASSQPSAGPSSTPVGGSPSGPPRRITWLERQKELQEARRRAGQAASAPVSPVMSSLPLSSTMSTAQSVPTTATFAATQPSAPTPPIVSASAPPLEPSAPSLADVLAPPLATASGEAASHHHAHAADGSDLAMSVDGRAESALDAAPLSPLTSDVYGMNSPSPPPPPPQYADDDDSDLDDLNLVYPESAPPSPAPASPSSNAVGRVLSDSASPGPSNAVSREPSSEQSEHFVRRSSRRRVLPDGLAEPQRSASLRSSEAASPAPSDSSSSSYHYLEMEPLPTVSYDPHSGASLKGPFDDICIDGHVIIVNTPARAMAEHPPEVYYARDIPTEFLDRMNSLQEPYKTDATAQLAFLDKVVEATMDVEPEAPPITVVNDIDDQMVPGVSPWEFFYTNQMWLGDGVPKPNLEGLRGCSCVGKCDPTNLNCRCAGAQEMRYPDAKARGFQYDVRTGRLNDNVANNVPIYECNDLCGCLEDCPNRVVQQGRRYPLAVKKTLDKGWGVFAAGEKIPRNSYIGIYAGELLTYEEADERGHYYDKFGRCYLLDIEYWYIGQPRDQPIDDNFPEMKDCEFVVDAFHAGNFTRFLNHSCDPNCRILPCYINESDDRKPLLTFWTTRDIGPDEELTFTYKDAPDADEMEKLETALDNRDLDMAVYQKCMCGAKNCRKILFK